MLLSGRSSRHEGVVRREHGPKRAWPVIFTHFCFSASRKAVSVSFILVCPLQVRARAYGLQFSAIFASEKLFALAVLVEVNPFLCICLYTIWSYKDARDKAVVSQIACDGNRRKRTQNLDLCHCHVVSEPTFEPVSHVKVNN